MVLAIMDLPILQIQTLKKGKRPLRMKRARKVPPTDLATTARLMRPRMMHKRRLLKKRAERQRTGQKEK